jgi:hypothetical protein
MFNLKIVKLTQQRETKLLVKILLGLPGLDSKQVSNGLKVPPFLVFSTENEREAMELMDTLEKYGAVCVIENTEALSPKNESAEKETVVLAKKEKNKMGWLFAVVIFLVLMLIIIISYIDDDKKYKIQAEQMQAASKSSNNAPNTARGLFKKETEASATGTTVAQTAGNASNKDFKDTSESKVNRDLKKEVVRNPYNDNAWKILSENLEKEGDTVAARSARESYEKAVKAQRILSGLAKAFGNDVRVEVREKEVYYRTSKDLTDKEFEKEAQKLGKNLISRFPGRDVVIENYTSDNNVQITTIKATE